MLTTIAKRIQSRLSRLGVKASLGDIKEQCIRSFLDIENPSEEEILVVQEYFLSTASQLTVVNETVEELYTEVDDVDNLKTAGDDLAIAPPQPAPLAVSNKSELITSTASQMGIVLDASEISLIAENINHSSDDFDQDIDSIKAAIMAFIQHKSMINQSKINELIHEVREVVGAKNTENSQLLSDGLRSINQDIQEANKQFKSNVRTALSAFELPALKAG